MTKKFEKVIGQSDSRRNTEAAPTLDWIYPHLQLTFRMT